MPSFRSFRGIIRGSRCRKNSSKNIKMDGVEGAGLSASEFFEKFPDEQAAEDLLEAERWPDGAVVPFCDSD